MAFHFFGVPLGWCATFFGVLLFVVLLLFSCANFDCYATVFCATIFGTTKHLCPFPTDTLGCTDDVRRPPPLPKLSRGFQTFGCQIGF